MPVSFKEKIGFAASTSVKLKDRSSLIERADKRNQKLVSGNKRDISHPRERERDPSSHQNITSSNAKDQALQNYQSEKNTNEGASSLKHSSIEQQRA
jgi:hypothetical protein